MPILRLMLVTTALLFSFHAFAEDRAENDSGVLGVDHIGLTVKDLEASKNLFTEVLGFNVGGSDPDYPAYFLDNGQTFITLWQVINPEEATEFNRKANVGLHHLALGVETEAQLNALYTTLKSYPGVNIEFAPELSYGGPDKHMMFNEPSGNRIELVHRVKRDN